ncbi:hypothetical protein B9Q02_05325 [Candidatus Marsarchaeota G1 archaeon BE_D]|jgi:sugar-specific transcriptional regulator TrmB|uniref:Transcription regulator TrmB N-terminal domain-containing protein n=1 Tax=Candidatus Marsarchaeota G1 archaeon BE_D TaxID=1978156 RepID=A0A2R6AH12_9ARCH|nr:MAG: hypothetical protein B9Q02_05325 [Candidatus Marsarchaeota G1 archaeon BE_D]
MKKLDPKELAEFGLSEHESRIYSALVEHGPCTMAELAQRALVPRTKVYPNVKKLVSKGFVECLPDKPMRCRAVSPEKVLRPILKEKQNQVEEMNKLLDALNQLFSEKAAENMERKEFWVFSDKSSALNSLKKNLLDAREEIFVVLNKWGTKTLVELKEALRKCVDKKVKLQLIAPYTLEDLEKIQDFRDLASIRLVPQELSDFVMIIDSSTLFLLSSTRVTQGYGGFSSLLVNDSRLSETVRTLLNATLWEQGSPIESVKSLLGGSESALRAVKAANPSVYADAVISAFGQWILDTYGEKNGERIIRNIALNALKTIEEEEGLKLSTSSIEDALKAITELTTFNEKVEVDFDSEDPMNYLNYVVYNATSASYKKSQASKSNILMTAWGILTEAIFELYGYETVTMQTVYDRQKQQWMAWKKVLKKGAKLKSLDEALEEIQKLTKMLENQKQSDG